MALHLSAMSQRLIDLPRSSKQTLAMVCDSVLLVFALWCAYSLRLGEWFFPSVSQSLLMLAAPALAVPVFIRNGLYRSVIRYVGEHALFVVVRAMALSTLAWTVLAFLTEMTGVQGVPRSVPFLYALLGILYVGGIRFFARWLFWLPLRRRFAGRQVLIYGAGGAGRQLAASLRQGNEMFPAGFIDDDSLLQGKDIQGLRVYAPAELERLIKRFGITDIIVTLPSASSLRRRQVVTFLENFAVRVRILPAMGDIASGRHLVNLVREVDVGDLLGRDAIAAQPELLARCISGRVVMVTGAGGSIGSELCQQIAALEPARLVLLESSEHALYQIDRALKVHEGLEVVPMLASVCDAGRVADIIAEQRVETIYHAAAYKHVPLVQSNPAEGIRNNVMGTFTVARAALEAGVEAFVLISTDKAVRPPNVMGASKRWAELVVQDCARVARERGTGQRFCAVRFGNVLGSSGSVIPLFKEQIRTGGPVTVTHPEVTRYFMSIHEAVELVIQAGSMAEGGEVFLLDMGEPVKIMDLARNMIRMAGYQVRDAQHPDGDIEIAITGLRPGEKLYEELLIANRNATGTQHSKILKAMEPGPADASLEQLYNALLTLLQTGDTDEARRFLLAVANDQPVGLDVGALAALGAGTKGAALRFPAFQGRGRGQAG